jgi:transposase
MFNEKQLQIFTGSMLGDGTIVKNCQNGGLCRFQVSQSQTDHAGCDKTSYMNFYLNEFDDFSTKIISASIKASGVAINPHKNYFDRYVFYTHNLRFWEKLESKWYVPRTGHPRFKRRKIVPTDIKLTPLTLCVWHMDDGSNNQTDANIELNTQSFTVDEVEFLIERLKKDLGIDSHKKAGGKKEGQYKIYIGRNSYFDFIEMIKQHVEWDCFKYKIDTSGYNKQPHRGETHSGSILTEEKVREIFRMRDKGMLQKDIAEKVGSSNISAILSGEQWSHLGLSRYKFKKPRLSKEAKQQIANLQAQGLSQNQIAERLNINQSTVSRILRGA